MSSATRVAKMRILLCVKISNYLLFNTQADGLRENTKNAPCYA